jgi:hypothetical protein
MRSVLVALFLMLAGCNGYVYEGCHVPCKGAFSSGIEFLCDGGVCPPGEAVAAPFFQCLCRGPAGTVQSLVFPEPADGAACEAARANWNAFLASHCS